MAPPSSHGRPAAIPAERSSTTETGRQRHHRLLQQQRRQRRRPPSELRRGQRLLTASIWTTTITIRSSKGGNQRYESRTTFCNDTKRSRLSRRHFAPPPFSVFSSLRFFFFSPSDLLFWRFRLPPSGLPRLFRGANRLLYYTIHLQSLTSGTRNMNNK